MHRLFKIGEVSRLYHIGVDSLRYYEEIGLIHPERSSGGYRMYSETEIGKLNVIRDLRELGFSMESIRQYLEFQNVDTAMNLLQQELDAIREKMLALTRLRENVEKRMDSIRTAQNLPKEEIQVLELPARRCYYTQQGYVKSGEMDVMMKKLANRSSDQLYMIGSHQFGSVIPMDSREPHYKAVFAIDEGGDSQLPAGTYLSVCYGGGYGNSGKWMEKLRNFAQRKGYILTGDFLELLWIDNHTTQNEREFITQLQVPVSTEETLAK